MSLNQLKLGLSWKLTILNIASLGLLAIVLSAIMMIDVRDGMERQAIARQANNLAVAWDVLRAKGGDFSVQNGQLTIGDVVLNDNEAIVDHVQSLVGGVATIFMGDVRVATNIKQPNGTRSVGTKLAQGPAWQAVFQQHKSYQGIVDILGQPYYSRYEPIVDRSGNVIGCLFVGLPQNEFLAIVDALIREIVQAAILVTLVLGGAALWVTRRSFRAFATIQSVLARCAAGDLSGEVPFLDRGDEIGKMAGAVKIFQKHSQEVDRLRKDQEHQEERAAEERKRALNQLADSFEARVMDVVKVVSSSSTELQATAQTMTQAASQATTQATTVAAAAEQATTNVQTVASAAEELSASISEISRQVVESTRISTEAAEGTERTNDMVQSLSAAADRIGEVVQLINDIASQTNLLALNATIEAARAGDAGKGFAVVANEVKNLANQTGRATEEIGQQISSVQEETRRTVEAIKEIGSVIHQVRQVSSGIAAAVEEQGAATQEIARNVHQAAQGTQEVSNNIGGVSQSATTTGTAAEQVFVSASDLAANSEKLREEVSRFLTEVRAA
jgi:methyl-accepting chemotaxis protein